MIWMGERAWNGSAYIQNPIEVEVAGSNIDRFLPPVQGRTYNIAGFEIVVSEVYNDYDTFMAVGRFCYGLP